MVSLQFKAAYAIPSQVAAYLFCVFRCPSSATQPSTSASYSVATRLQSFRLRGQSRLLPCGSSQFHRDADLASPVLFRANSQPVNQLLRYAFLCRSCCLSNQIKSISNSVHFLCPAWPASSGPFPFSAGLLPCLAFSAGLFRFRAHRCRSGSVRIASQPFEEIGAFPQPVSAVLLAAISRRLRSGAMPFPVASSQIQSFACRCLARAYPVLAIPMLFGLVQSLPAHCFPGRSHSFAVLHGASPTPFGSSSVLVLAIPLLCLALLCLSFPIPCSAMEFRCRA